MNSVKLLLFFVVATILVVFGAQNTQPITIHFLVFKLPSTPVVSALAVAALLGALLTFIGTLFGRVRSAREQHRADRTAPPPDETNVVRNDLGDVQPILTDSGTEERERAR